MANYVCMHLEIIWKNGYVIAKPKNLLMVPPENTKQNL